MRGNQLAASNGGRRSGAGRKKDTPNKITSDLKAAILEAFCEAGGVTYLRKIAKSKPQVFCALLGKILPPQTQISAEPSNPLPIKRIELVVIEPPKNITPVKSAPKGLLAEVPASRASSRL